MIFVVICRVQSALHSLWKPQKRKRYRIRDSANARPVARVPKRDEAVARPACKVRTSIDQWGASDDSFSKTPSEASSCRIFTFLRSTQYSILEQYMNHLVEPSTNSTLKKKIYEELQKSVLIPPKISYHKVYKINCAEHLQKVPPWLPARWLHGGLWSCL